MRENAIAFVESCWELGENGRDARESRRVVGENAGAPGENGSEVASIQFIHELKRIFIILNYINP